MKNKPPSSIQKSIKNTAQHNVDKKLKDVDESQKKAIHLLRYINYAIIHSSIGFNLYWLVFLGGKYLNDVITLAWVGVPSLPITLSLTLYNLVFVNDKNLKIITYLNTLLFCIIIALRMPSHANHEWDTFFIRFPDAYAFISLLYITPFALISLGIYYGIKLITFLTNKDRLCSGMKD